MRHFILYIYIQTHTHTCTPVSLMVSADLKAPCKDSVWGPRSPCRPAGPPGCCPIPNMPYGFCGCKGHPLSPVPNKPLVSVDVKVTPCPPSPISLMVFVDVKSHPVPHPQYAFGFCGRKGHPLSHIPNKPCGFGGCKGNSSKPYGF